MEKEPTKSLNIWIPTELHAALDKRSKEERRSMTQQAIIALEEHLNKEEHA